jgi:chorismate mutase
MSPSSHESNLAQYREALLHLNAQFCMIVSERRAISLKIQGLKTSNGRFPNFDPEREKLIFELMKDEFKSFTIKELLAFSLIMEDQAMTLAPGAYPTWSQGVHLTEYSRDPFTMINPVLLKIGHPELFARLNLNPEFGFLKEF